MKGVVRADHGHQLNSAAVTQLAGRTGESPKTWACVEQCASLSTRQVSNFDLGGLLAEEAHFYPHGSNSSTGRHRPAAGDYSPRACGFPPYGCQATRCLASDRIAAVAISSRVLSTPESTAPKLASARRSSNASQFRARSLGRPIEKRIIWFVQRYRRAGRCSALPSLLIERQPVCRDCFR